MSKSELVKKAYEIAKEQYAAIGVDVDAAIAKMKDVTFRYTVGKPMMLVVLKLPMANFRVVFRQRVTIREKPQPLTK